MAGSKFAYVRKFELPDTLLPGTFMVLRLDGHSFHRCVAVAKSIAVVRSCTRNLSFSEMHGFSKPNDVRALALMDHAAGNLLEQYPDIVFAFGQSDEFRSILFCSHASSTDMLSSVLI